MPNEEKMTINERRKYLRLIKKRYLKASKLERGRLPDEMEAVWMTDVVLSSSLSQGRCLPVYATWPAAPTDPTKCLRPRRLPVLGNQRIYDRA